MDDIVDEAPDNATAQLAIKQCSEALEAHFGLSDERTMKDSRERSAWGGQNRGMPPTLRSSIAQLPASRLALELIMHLQAGLETDLHFSDHEPCHPISTEQDLDAYAYNVAGSVAASILGLTFCYYPMKCPASQQRSISAGEAMGCALQYVNIARDIGRDAAIGRVYIPTTWLKDEGLGPADVIANPCRSAVARLRCRMLDKADAIYQVTVDAIFELPREIRRPMLTLVDSYMAIGKTVGNTPVEALGQTNNLKLPLLRRLWVAREAMLKAGMH